MEKETLLVKNHSYVVEWQTDRRRRNVERQTKSGKQFGYIYSHYWFHCVNNITHD